MDTYHTPHGLAAFAHDLILSLSAPRLGPFLAAWPTPALTTPESPVAAQASDTESTFPVIEWLPHIARQHHLFAAPLISALCRVAPGLAWRQTYARNELGADFMSSYAYTEILGPRAPLASDRIACGFLLLGPSTLYPRHRHEAEEIYVTLTGGARWQQGDDVWRERAAGSVIHHASEEPHAMHTAERPLLAMYLWRSADLNQTARLDSTETPKARATV